jgi:hypothetical protein
METPIYLHLKPGETPPRLEGDALFKAVVVIDSDVSPQWQVQISDWLVRSGCRYMMAWGQKCGDWNSSVDEASLAMFDYGEVPDDDFVMTTWHANEPLQETFWFSEQCAMHPSLELERTYVVHIAPEARATELLKTFRAAQEETDSPRFVRGEPWRCD